MDFKGSLKIKGSEVEAPPLAPTGHYVFRVEKTSYGEVGQGKWDTVDFILQAEQPDEDVDPQKLKEAGGVKAVRLNKRYMFPRDTDDESKVNFEKTLYYMTQFLTTHLGVADDRIDKMVENARGQSCIANVEHRQDNRDENVYYAQIGKTAPLS